MVSSPPLPAHCGTDMTATLHECNRHELPENDPLFTPNTESRQRPARRFPGKEFLLPMAIRERLENGSGRRGSGYTRSGGRRGNRRDFRKIDIKNPGFHREGETGFGGGKNHETRIGKPRSFARGAERYRSDIGHGVPAPTGPHLQIRQGDLQGGRDEPEEQGEDNDERRDPGTHHRSRNAG
jgi:hypothetical protein